MTRHIKVESDNPASSSRDFNYDEEEDWSTNANAPTFNLFAPRDPKVEAAKDGFIDPSTFHRWSKADQKLYSKLKGIQLIEKMRQKNNQSIDEITEELEKMTLLIEEGVIANDFSEIMERMKNMQIGKQEIPCTDAMNPAFR